MSDASFVNLLVVMAVAVAAPLVVASVRGLKVPAVVLELVAGIGLGPSGLGWVERDELVGVMAQLGLVFLLFLVGLEVDLERLRGRLLDLAVAGYGLTLALGLAVGAGARLAGWVSNPLFVALVLSATSLGLVGPVLRDAGRIEAPLGQLVIAGATVADLTGVVLLSLAFSGTEGGPGAMAVAVAGFVAVVAAAALALGRANRSLSIDALLVRLQDTTAEIRVRMAVLLLVGFVVLAGRVGLETILAAFVAGAVLNLVDRDASSHPQFRLKLDAIGYGFLIPVFFVASGIGFDLAALVRDPSSAVRVPVFVAALIVVRGVPALLYLRRLSRRQVAAAGLLQATSLPFIVTATAIGTAVGALDAVTSAALVAAGLLSVIVFPAVAVALLGPDGGPSPIADQADTTAIGRPAGGPA